MKYLLALLVTLQLGCSHRDAKPAQPSDLVAKLRGKYAGWLAELKTSADQPSGWPSATDCDGTLWAGEAAAGGLTLNLGLAEAPAGMIHRRPVTAGECFPDASASTISQDMLMGYMLGSYATRDLGALERLADYGEHHNWVMGEPFPAEPRVVLEPSGQGILGRAIEKLGGPAKAYSLLPIVCLPVAADYEHHLQTLGIFLNGDVAGGTVPQSCYERLRANAGAAPADGLLAAVYGIYSGDEAPALELLTGDTYTCPGYVRGAATYCLVHEIFAAKTILNRFGGL